AEAEASAARNADPEASKPYSSTSDCELRARLPSTLKTPHSQSRSLPAGARPTPREVGDAEDCPPVSGEPRRSRARFGLLPLSGDDRNESDRTFRREARSYDSRSVGAP